MKRQLWFLVGLMASAAVLLVWLQAAGLVHLVWPGSQPTRATATAAASATVVPTETPLSYALIWEREITLADRCDVLQVDPQGRVLYGVCGQSLQAQQLLSEEQSALLALRAQYAADHALYQTSPGNLDNETIRLRFAGQGAQSLDAFSRGLVGAWAAQVYDRLTREALQANLVALARGHLAGRLNMAPGAITVVSVAAVTWVDRCLGIPQVDGQCAPVVTPGLRIVLAAGSIRYEYRTDLLGKVLPFDLAAPPGLTPTSAVGRVTATLAPTNMPTAVASAVWPPAATSTPTTTSQPSPTAMATATATRAVDGWSAAYYANRDLIEPPAMRRQDLVISFNWGDLAPDPSLPDERFSVRWTRRIGFQRGYYRFDVQADDGARLWVDNVLVLDNWTDGYTEHSVEAYLAGGEAPVILEYYENEGLAEVGLTWRLSEPGARRTATPTPEPVFAGWRGAYYNNTLFVGDPVVVRNDPNLDFDWGTAAPAGGVPQDRFAVRWSRDLWFAQGAYRFNARVDDGMRLWIDDRIAIDDWRSASARDLVGYRWLSEGWHTVRMDYFEDAGLAEARLDWVLIKAFPDWRAAYYDNRFLAGDPILVRNESEIAYDWGEGAPWLGMPDDDFSVRWTRLLYLDAGRYRFQATVDDGVRFYLDDALLIDEWHDADQKTYTRAVDLVSGYHALRVDYYEHNGDARCTVSWSRE